MDAMSNTSIEQIDAIKARLQPTSLGMSDGRARFREIFNTINEARGGSLPDAMPTHRVFRDIGNEAAPSGAPVDLGGLSGKLWVVAVGGYLSACMRWTAPVFGDGLKHLQSLGANVSTALVAGRSGTVHNAKIIRDTVEALPIKEGDRVVIVAHSKGVIDTLQMFADHGDATQKISALIGVTGAVRGSSLALEFPYLFRQFLVHMPLPTCSTGDKMALHDIEPGVRLAFLQRLKIPEHIKTYTLAAWPERNLMSLGFRPMRTLLDAHDMANDGQVAVPDMAIPGSSMLGVLNCDHVAPAMPFNRDNRLIGKAMTGLLRTHNAFPREVLMEAAVRFAVETLDQ